MGFLFKPSQFLSLCHAAELTEVHRLKGGSPHMIRELRCPHFFEPLSGFLTLLIQRHGYSCAEQNLWM